MNDKQNVDRAVFELKRLSRTYKIPVIAISSLNRGSYSSDICMAAFKESGAIEYSSDVLIGLQLEIQKDKDKKDSTTDKGFFVFKASPDRTVEILAKPPNETDYIVFKTINSSVQSSEKNPVKVYLPKTIEEYRSKGKFKQSSRAALASPR